MFNEGPPSREAVTISFTCFDLELVNILVNSGIRTAASVPQVNIKPKEDPNPASATTKAPEPELPPTPELPVTSQFEPQPPVAEPSAATENVSRETFHDDDLWREALNAIKSKSKQLFGFLSPAKVNISENTAEIIITNSIAFERVGTPEGIKYLEDLFAQISGKPIAVKVTTGADSDEATTTPQAQFAGIDEIIEKQTEFGDIMQVE